MAAGAIYLAAKTLQVGVVSEGEGCVHFEDGHAQEDILGPETTACDVVPAFAEDV